MRRWLKTDAPRYFPSLYRLHPGRRRTSHRLAKGFERLIGAGSIGGNVETTVRLQNANKSNSWRLLPTAPLPICWAVTFIFACSKIALARDERSTSERGRLRVGCYVFGVAVFVISNASRVSGPLRLFLNNQHLLLLSFLSPRHVVFLSPLLFLHPAFLFLLFKFLLLFGLHLHHLQPLFEFHLPLFSYSILSTVWVLPGPLVSRSPTP